MTAAALLNDSMCAAAVTIAFKAALVNEVTSLFYCCGGVTNAVTSKVFVFIQSSDLLQRTTAESAAFCEQRLLYWCLTE